MSFFHMIPNNFQQVPVSYPSREVYSPQYYYYVNRPEPNQPSVARNIPFKVYIFDGKFDNLNNASNVLRFEIDSSIGSFQMFDRYLREHSIDMRSYDLHYIDDEHDLVALSTERDFHFMIKLMKGKLTKIVCEKKVNVQPQATFKLAPQTIFMTSNHMPSRCEANKNVAEQEYESMIEKALRNSLSNSGAQKQFFPSIPTRVLNNQPTRKESPRRIEISLADLLGIPRNKEQSSEQPKQEKKAPQSFSEFLQRMMGEEKEETTTEEKKEKPFETPNSIPKEESPISVSPQSTEEQPVNVENTPNMTTSLLISTNLELNEPMVEEQSEPASSESTPVPELPQQETSKQDLENQDPIIESIVDDEDQYVKTTIPHKYQKELKMLNDMGFSNHVVNVTLLNKYEGNLQRTISDLIHNH